MKRMEIHLEAFVSVLKSVLGRRLVKVYFVAGGEEGKVAEANVVILVEETDWTEDLIIHEEGARIMREAGVFFSPLIVSKNKWEHWRRLGKRVVSKVEEEGISVYEREDGECQEI